MSKSLKRDTSDRETAETYYAEIRDDANYHSSNLSTQVRTTTLSILAMTWLLLNGTEDSLEKKFGCFSSSLMWLAAFCVCALAADFLQGVISEREASAALASSSDAISEGRFDDVGYDDSPYRKVGNFLFNAKCVMVAAATVWLLVIVYRALSDSCLRVCS